MDDVYGAVVLQHRWWNWFDRSEAHLAVQRNSTLSGAAIRRIAGAYSVARGLRLVDEETAGWTVEQIDQHKTHRAELIGQLFRSHGLKGDLIERYNECQRLADVAEERGLTHGNQISAMTKFAWFLAPLGWTVFDDRAATGLAISNATTKQGTRSERFYKRLQERGFLEKSGHVRDVLIACNLSELPAERVLDTHLMLRKSQQKARDLELAAAYLATLDEPARSALTSAALKTSQTLGSDPLDLGAS